MISSTNTTTPAAPTRSVTPTPTVRLDGDVTGLSGTCPTLTFTVSRATVTTSASTTVEGGCTAIVNNATVSVTGTRQSDGTVVATRVAVRESQVTGAIGAVKGSCPVLTFTVAGTVVWMDATTVLNGLSCAQLVNGAMVRVDGFRRADGSILASAISAGRR